MGCSPTGGWGRLDTCYTGGRLTRDSPPLVGGENVEATEGWISIQIHPRVGGEQNIPLFARHVQVHVSISKFVYVHRNTLAGTTVPLHWDGVASPDGVLHINSRRVTLSAGVIENVVGGDGVSGFVNRVGYFSTVGCDLLWFMMKFVAMSEIMMVIRRKLAGLPAAYFFS